SAPGKTPFEYFLVRPSLKSSLGQVIITNSQKSRAASVEESWILYPNKISRGQMALGMEPDLIQHSSKIDQAFRLAIIAAWSLVLHARKSFRPCGKVSTVHLARRGHTTLLRACGVSHLGRKSVMPQRYQ